MRGQCLPPCTARIGARARKIIEGKILLRFLCTGLSVSNFHFFHAKAPRGSRSPIPQEFNAPSLRPAIGDISGLGVLAARWPAVDPNRTRAGPLFEFAG